MGLLAAAMVMLLTVDLAVGQTTPEFEDVPSGHVAETAIDWAAANTEEMAYTITSAIPHRLAYFDSLHLNLCPLVNDRDC